MGRWSNGMTRPWHGRDSEPSVKDAEIRLLFHKGISKVSAGPSFQFSMTGDELNKSTNAALDLLTA